MDDTLGSVLVRACQRYGGRTAIVGRDGSRTFSDLLERK